MFTLVGLTLAYVSFRKDQPTLISSAFHSLIGNKVHGPIGKGIDILSIIVTCTRIATTFGLGALQISGGLNHITSDYIPNNAMTYIVVIAIVTVLFVFSAASGVNKGMKILSNISLTVAAFLLLFMIIFGPTLFIAEGVITTIGSYIANFVKMSLDLKPFGSREWLGNYTIFFWAWHISWAPFLGIFIARISRGRTIRQFVIGVLIVPSLLAMIWFTAFGGTTLKMILDGHDVLPTLILENVEMALFATLGELPFSFFMSIVALFLIIIFFITSADSAAYVLASLSSNGSLNPKLILKVIWGLLIAATSSVLLFSGGLSGLQSASIIAALPFAVIMVVMLISIFIMMTRDLKAETLWKNRTETRKLKHEMRHKIKDAVYDEVKEEVYKDMKDEVYSEMKEEVYEQVKEEIYEDVKEEVVHDLKDEMYDDLKKEMKEEINNGMVKKKK